MAKKGHVASAKQTYNSTKARASNAFKDGKISRDEARRRLENAARMAQIDSEAQHELQKADQDRKRNSK